MFPLLKVQGQMVKLLFIGLLKCSDGGFSKFKHSN